MDAIGIMIPRTILSSIEESISLKPVTLITGPRQAGKTTICKLIAERHGFDYVSLADRSERMMASNDPEFFLNVHPAPLIIDEVQYAPALFDAIEGVIDKRKFDTGSNEGMYILTGSQAYNLMQGVTQSMTGRISIIEMSPLSISEITGREELPFTVDFERNILRASKTRIPATEVYSMIVRGSYPELYEKPSMRASKFYSEYVD